MLYQLSYIPILVAGAGFEPAFPGYEPGPGSGYLSDHPAIVGAPGRIRTCEFPCFEQVAFASWLLGLETVDYRTGSRL